MLPHASPAWLSPRRVAVGVAPLGVAMALAWWPSPGLLSIAAAMIVALLGARLAVRSPSVVTAIVGAVVTLHFARAAAGIGDLLWWLPYREWHIVPAFSLGHVFTPRASDLLAVAWGWSVMDRVLRVQRRPTPDAVDRVQQSAGVWLAVTAAVPFAFEPQRPWVPALGVAAGVALFADALARRARRMRWLERVRAGREPGWSVGDGKLRRHEGPPFRETVVDVALVD
jgi:hypothetical protein